MKTNIHLHKTKTIKVEKCEIITNREKSQYEVVLTTMQHEATDLF